jgi:hypothetical protein
MGIWGDGIFENDAASAAKAIFEVALADGAAWFKPQSKC